MPSGFKDDRVKIGSLCQTFFLEKKLRMITALPVRKKPPAKHNNHPAEFTSFVRRDILRAAVLLWRMPFFAALSITDFVVSSFLTAVSLSSLLLAAVLNSLTIFFTEDLDDLLRKRLVSFCRARFKADL
jgi:hypothetical protein